MPTTPTHDADELANSIWKAVKHDSLASSKMGYPSAETRDKIKQLIKADREAAVREARIEELSLLRDVAILAEANETPEDVDYQLIESRIAELQSQQPTNTRDVA